MRDLKLPPECRIFEVGPRDGLQNEPKSLTLEKKLEYIEALVAAGIRDIEVGAFVREDKIPQMAHSKELLERLRDKGYDAKKEITFWTLVPNEKGLDRALEAKARAIALFTGATDTFTEKNIGMSIKDSLKVFEKVTARATKEGIRVRGYISTVWGCPFEGEVSPGSAVGLARNLLDMGIEQVSLGDTIGVATPIHVMNLLVRLHKEITKNQIAGHFHDTRGTAVANCLAALSVGIKTLDSSSAGLGGCNYAPGASGNVATEDLVYMLSEMGVKTGINLEKLCEASRIAVNSLGRSPFSRYLQAWLSTH